MIIEEIEICDECLKEKEEMDLDHSLCNDCLDSFINGKEEEE